MLIYTLRGDSLEPMVCFDLVGNIELLSNVSFSAFALKKLRGKAAACPERLNQVLVCEGTFMAFVFPLP